MGFTAINASTTGSATGPDASRVQDNKDAATPVTLASEYLGRGEVEATAAPVAATSKKVPTKGKKRAAATKESKFPKRRKSSNVHDDLKVIKARAAQESSRSLAPSNSSPQQPSKGKTSRYKSSSTAKKPKLDAQPVGDDHAADILSKPKPVSVYAQATSMDALNSTSARTSIDFVKANAGQSITVYRDPSSSISHHSNVEFTQPWLNDATDLQTKGSNENVANKRFPKAKVRSSNIGATPQHKIGDSAQTFLWAPTDESARHSTGPEMRRSTRAKPEINYAGHDGFIFTHDSDSSDAAATRQLSETARRRTRSSETIGAEDGFGDIDDDDLMESALAIDDAIVDRLATSPPRGWKQNMRDVDEHEEYGGALLTNHELKLLAQIKTNESEKDAIDKPIVRKPFAKAIQDRSPLFGASNTTLLRTCFRVGEALNTGSQAVRCNKNVIIELYARVTSSWRDPPPGWKQHFVFKDLYHDKPPYLEGVFELWNQAQLWDLDSRPFLKATEKSMMARAIAKMKRDGQKWRLEVLSVWEATWEDVNYVAGICNDDVRKDSDLEDDE